MTGPSHAFCRRCGSCCVKGGPALRLQDAPLLSSGRLQAKDLHCLRQGELARQGEAEELLPLKAEVVKIAPTYKILAPGQAEDWTCRFLSPAQSCKLHGEHPLECRLLYCSDPAELLALPEKERLSRQDVFELLQAPPWWSEMAAAHEEGCNYAKLAQLAPLLDQDAKARQAWLEIVEFDRVFRQLCLERQAAAPEELDFILGRPLLRTMIMFGLEVQAGPEGRLSLRRTRIFSGRL